MSDQTTFCGEPGCHRPATLRFRSTVTSFFTCDRHKGDLAYRLITNRYDVEKFDGRPLGDLDEIKARYRKG